MALCDRLADWTRQFLARLSKSVQTEVFDEDERSSRLAENQRGTAISGRPRFGEALRFWLKLGFISFGGPTGQIAIMHTELVERKRWIDEERFLHALNFCMLLPGPEAQQLATYIGWFLHGTWGGVVAGALSCCRLR